MVRSAFFPIFARIQALALMGFLGFNDIAGAEESALLQSLQGGGHIIYFRHAATDWSQYDRVHGPGDWASCDPQQMRQLSAEGREMARQVGAAIRHLQIPVGDIFASEYCRSKETAELLGLGPVQTTRDILNARAAEYIGGREALMQSARQRLATPPPAGKNTILVAHGNVFVLVAGIRPVEAGAAIVRPDGKGGFTLIELLEPAAWATLNSDAGIQQGANNIQ